MNKLAEPEDDSELANLTLQHLKCFAAVAEHGSITRAAKQLNTTKPNLITAIRKIENRVGKTLFQQMPWGVQLTEDGAKFLQRARQFLKRTNMPEKHREENFTEKKRFFVSTQHYAFAAKAFVELINSTGYANYEFGLLEGKTNEVIMDVRNLKSEFGIIFLSAFNDGSIRKLLRDNSLNFTPLFMISPCVFLSRKHPLAACSSVNLEELSCYPCVTFNHGIENSFYYTEELLNTRVIDKRIVVSDRAAAVNFLTSLHAYVISTEIYPEYLHGNDIISIPLDIREQMEVGYVQNRHTITSEIGLIYIEALKKAADDII